MTPDAHGAELASTIDRRLGIAAVVANSLGALVVFVFIAYIGPSSFNSTAEELPALNAVALALYLVVTLLGGRRWIRTQTYAPLRRWLSSDQPATETEQILVLRYPLFFARLCLVFWAGAAVLFTAFNAPWLGNDALTIGPMVLLGMVPACALQYLVAERILRPATARALGVGPPPRLAGPGVAGRITMTWLLATGMPLLGLAALATRDLLGEDLDRDRLVAATLFLAVAAAVAGLLAMRVAARSVADPVSAVRDALERIERGELATRVPVDDGSELGLLQAGFNRMAGGLEERERLREAFGAFVDPGLAERVLAEGVDLAGDDVELSVMFLDVRGFTTFAETAPPREVVSRLNELYSLIVPIVLGHGGHANKFIGDGLLAVFGAPERLPDHARCAVSAAREIAATVDERSELRVGIGINSGSVVAGTIGGGGRVDFTVIGDVVNTAARVEAATRNTGDTILITESTLAMLDAAGASDGTDTEWEPRPPVPLKGKAEPITLYAPVAQERARPATRVNTPGTR